MHRLGKNVGRPKYGLLNAFYSFKKLTPPGIEQTGLETRQMQQLLHQRYISLNYLFNYKTFVWEVRKYFKLLFYNISG